jgi:hypothetical protein
LLGCEDHILLTALSNKAIVGFIIGKLVEAPKVYDPGGLTLMIDDFCIGNAEDWNTVGFSLISEIKKVAKEKGASQIVVVSGDSDTDKCLFLEKVDLSIASKWYVGSL